MGDREAHLAHARARLAALPRTRWLKSSRVEETAPLGPVPQGPYLNQMALLETELEPAELLAHLQAIERERGRVRRARWGPRTLDLDIVKFGDRSPRGRPRSLRRGGTRSPTRGPGAAGRAAHSSWATCRSSATRSRRKRRSRTPAA